MCFCMYLCVQVYICPLKGVPPTELTYSQAIPVAAATTPAVTAAATTGSIHMRDMTHVYATSPAYTFAMNQCSSHSRRT